MTVWSKVVPTLVVGLSLAACSADNARTVLIGDKAKLYDDPAQVPTAPVSGPYSRQAPEKPVPVVVAVVPAPAQAADTAKAAADKAAADKAEADRLAQVQAVAEKLAAEKAEAARRAAAEAEAARLAAEQAHAAAVKLAAAEAEAVRLASAKAAAEQVAAAEAEAARLAAVKAEADRVAAAKAESDRLAAAKAEADRLAAVKAAEAAKPQSQVTVQTAGVAPVEAPTSAAAIARGQSAAAAQVPPPVAPVAPAAPDVVTVSPPLAQPQVVASIPIETFEYVKQGNATWYRRTAKNNITTASGEPLNNQGFTAAHPKLPFGTIVRVTDPATQRFVDVRINDRGPFGNPKLIIDLSEAAARKIGLHVRGFMPVTLDVIKPPPG